MWKRFGKKFKINREKVKEKAKAPEKKGFDTKSKQISIRTFCRKIFKKRFVKMFLKSQTILNWKQKIRRKIFNKTVGKSFGRKKSSTKSYKNTLTEKGSQKLWTKINLGAKTLEGNNQSVISFVDRF